MKIAHINNIAGVASTLARQQTKNGHTSEVFVFNEDRKKQFGGTFINYRSTMERWRFLHHLRSYDVIHYHYPEQADLTKIQLFSTFNRKILIKHYHGSDLRGRHDDDFCLVSTPDLLNYAPNGVWLPNPVDLDEIDALRSSEIRPRQSGRGHSPLIAHYPYYKIAPFEDNYSATLCALEKESKCKVVSILGVSHSESLRMIAECDIIIGKIMPEMGWFSRFELEGMAMGKPVIAFVSDELFEKHRPPIWRTTKDTFRKDLQELLDNNSEMERLSRYGMEYVRNLHTPDKVAHMLDKFYELRS